MSNPSPREREIIESTSVIERGKVRDVEGLRIVWSIAIAVMALVIAVAILLVGIFQDKSDLTTWATSLISAIAGAAISYGFNSKTH